MLENRKVTATLVLTPEGYENKLILLCAAEQKKPFTL